jgi:hypothetical protein
MGWGWGLGPASKSNEQGQWRICPLSEQDHFESSSHEP